MSAKQQKTSQQYFEISFQGKLLEAMCVTFFFCLVYLHGIYIRPKLILLKCPT